MHSLDPFLVDKVVSEVKSAGVFDQFRRDSMSDVDTKPAYQNLRQRVETTVTRFLDEIKWTPELNKNQLREKLRKHITETGILDTGVDRIVEQVVNPKVITVFQPKIEDIAYNYLGIEKPEIKVEEIPQNLTNGDLSIETDFLPTDLEAVSPDSDKATEEKFEPKEDLIDSDDKIEEFESPPFEPLEGLGRPPSVEKKEDSNHSQLSGISGLTSQDSMDQSKADISLTNQNDATQESNLSVVSSNSQLSIVTNGNDDSKSDIKEEANVGISEEAQMPKFADNSSADVPNKDLHFDIKKEEIKFEGTEWKSEKQAYFSGINENLTTDNDTVKTEFEQTNVEVDMASKVEDVSASSNLTYSTDTQNSATSKPGDFDKSEKDNSRNLETKDEEKDKSTIPENIEKTPEIDQGKYSSISKSKENDVYQKKSYKKSVDKEKSSSGDSRSRHSDSRNDSRSPRTHSSSRKHKSSNDHHRSKSSSHKRKHSRTRDRSRERSDKSRDKKHRSDKDKNDKKLENCSERNKKYRRKSTDSNDDPTGSKDTSKNTSPSLIDKNGSGKEILNSSSSSSFSGSTNGSVEATLSAKNYPQMILANTCTYRKPVILDSLLSNTARGNVELVIGSQLLINENMTNDNPTQHDEDLRYFEQDPIEEERCLTALERLSKFLNNQKLSYIYVYYCNEGYKRGFAKQCNKVIDIGFDNLYFRSDNIQNNKGKNSRKKRSSTKSINEKQKPGDDNFYHGAYQVFTDDKIENNRSSLIIDCFEYNGKPSAPKKIKANNNFELDSFPKISPTPSDMSAGSKENDCAAKKTSAKSSEQLEAEALKRSIAFKNSQRYTSEDLYKPRPILGQRSRRRAIEAEGI